MEQDYEPNKISTEGTFDKAKMIALMQALTRCVELYPEHHYSFNITIEGIPASNSGKETK